MRSVLIGILLTFGQGVHAQSWMSLSQRGEENRFYIDTESIVSKDNVRRATMLANYLQAQANGVQSIKATVEFQCDEVQWRTIDRSYLRVDQIVITHPGRKHRCVQMPL
ncbi:MAG: hypothetical protein EBW19_13480 [Betaproteobacteria bacterium]|nr:hypothetical protein [Betaproteobacteria bacterium]